MTTTGIATSAPARTLASVFDPKANALNAMRLVLASLVIVSHAWPLSGTGADPAFGGQTLGTWAVIGFFLISGFLITRSRDRRRAFDYYRDRFLRIYPGYLVAMAVTGFLFAPLSTLITGADWEPGAAVDWFVHNLPLYEQHFAITTIGGTLTGLPYEIWNGPVWSLFFEAFCYVVIGVGMTILPRRWVLPVVAALTVGLALATLLLVHSVLELAPIYHLALPAVLAFSVGALGYLLRDHLVITPATVALSTLLLAVVIATGQAQTLAAFTLVIPTFWLADAASFAHHIGVSPGHDISYGIYIYGWPVQTLLLLAARQYDWHIPIAVDIFVVLSVTTCLAWLSALFVEEPAGRLRAPQPARHAAGR